MIEDLPKKLDELQALKTLDVSLPPQIFSVFPIFSNFKCFASCTMMCNNVSYASHTCGVLKGGTPLGKSLQLPQCQP